MVLSDEVSLLYVLAESGVRGKLTSGLIERNPSGALVVYDTHGERFEYLSGPKLQSWCVVGPEGEPIVGWQEILPGDLPKLFPA
jgi:hypothetical protein